MSRCHFDLVNHCVTEAKTWGKLVETNFEMAVISNQARTTGARYLRTVLPLGLLLVVAALIAGFVVWPLSPTNLRNDHSASTELFSDWQAGEVVVLVRHGERCDRSSNTCAGPADGITLPGREVAAGVGSALLSMGMHSADIATSPLTRTAQTAQAMFGEGIAEQNWLVDCDTDMARDIKAHKAEGRNLVLITHSGCISRFEDAMGFPHARDTEYASSLFVRLGANGKLKVLGRIDAQDWPAVVTRNPAL